MTGPGARQKTPDGGGGGGSSGDVGVIDLTSDDATTALIARLLHEDQMHLHQLVVVEEEDGGGMSDGTEDGDFVPPTASVRVAKPRHRQQPARRRTAQQQPSQPQPPQQQPPQQQPPQQQPLRPQNQPEPVDEEDDDTLVVHISQATSEIRVATTAVTLATLMEAGLLAPGLKCFRIVFMSCTFIGSLCSDGDIEHVSTSENSKSITTIAPKTRFTSPSAWSLACKRTLNPSKMGDNGWTSVWDTRTNEQLAKIKDRWQPSANAPIYTPTPTKKAARRPSQPHQQQQDKLDPASVVIVDLPQHMESPSPTTSPSSCPAPGEDVLPPTKPPALDQPKRRRMAAGSSDDDSDNADDSVSNDTETEYKTTHNDHTAHTLRESTQPDIRARLRRPKPSVYHRSLVNNSSIGAHDLVPCEKLHPSDVPFVVRISTQALVTMDFHAHMSHAEIIGYLAGAWDPVSKVLEAVDAYPCRALESSEGEQQTGEDHDRGTNVEMDPESEMEVRGEIFDRQMTIVGWYHSHPIFQPDPSVRDIENQRSYQKLFQCDKTHLFPFIGVIIAPYQAKHVGDTSVVRIFVTDEPVVRPMTLPIEIFRNKAAPHLQLTPKLKTVAEYYARSPDAVYLNNIWRGQTSLRSKLRLSLESHLLSRPCECPECAEIIGRLGSADTTALDALITLRV